MKAFLPALTLAPVFAITTAFLWYNQSDAVADDMNQKGLASRVADLENRVQTIEAKLQDLRDGKNFSVGQPDEANSAKTYNDIAQSAGESVPYGQLFISQSFQLSVTEAIIKKPRVKDLFGDIGEGRTDQLILTLQVVNTDERRILRYREANMFLAGHFSLEDDVGNTIRGVTYGAGSEIVGALTGSDDILPGKTATHVEVFKKPPAATESLTLTVNLAAFGGEGQAKFVVPADKIDGFYKE